MRFWDSSALVPLVTREATSSRTEELLADDPMVATWWATSVECVSALVGKASDRLATETAVRDLLEFAATWTEVPPTEHLRERSIRCVRVHELRTGDAFQLAAAIVASENRPETLELVTLDTRLALAARREGFRVLPG